MNQFIEEVQRIKKQLDSLENRFIESYQNYTGNEFEEQNSCATEVENLTLMLTHEVSSQIQFGVHNLEILLKYIEFRKIYREYTDTELIELIDQNNNLHIKRSAEITERKNEQDITKIVAEWNNTFENIGYEKTKEKIRLNTDDTNSHIS